MAEPSGKRKTYKSFSILEKLEIITELEKSKIDNKSVSEKYGVPIRTLTGWKKNKEKLKKQQENYQLTNATKRIKISSLDDVDEAVYIWFDAAVRSGVNVTGPLIMEKARQLHTHFQISKPFVASNGWLCRWKKKFNVRLYTKCVDKLSSAADVNTVKIFRGEFEKFIDDEGLELCQIFNADETGLNYKSMPELTLDKKLKEAPSGMKANNERVTVMACSNADGSFKLPLVVVGKVAKPLAIKNQFTSLPVVYTHQNSARMSSDIFEKWFKEQFVPQVSDFLSARGLPLKATLLLDNAPCHSPENQLNVDEIKAKYMPADTASIMQPMGQGIIENLKRNFKSKFLLEILFAQSQGTEISTYLESVNIKHVIEWGKEAWDAVDKTTIFHCFKNVLPSEYYANASIQLPNILSNDELLKRVQRIPQYEEISDDSVKNWIEHDDDDDNGNIHVPSDEELFNTVMNNREDQTDELVDNVPEKVEPKDAVAAAVTLKNFFRENKVFSDDELRFLVKAKEEAMKIAISK